MIILIIDDYEIDYDTEEHTCNREKRGSMIVKGRIYPILEKGIGWLMKYHNDYN